MRGKKFNREITTDIEKERYLRKTSIPYQYLILLRGLACPHHILAGLLQYAIHGATLVDYLETTTGTERSSADSPGGPSGGTCNPIIV